MTKSPKSNEHLTFCCSYFHDGSWWGITITAYDWADAEVRAKKLGLRLDGEFVASIPALLPASGLVQAVVALRNRLSWRM